MKKALIYTFIFSLLLSGATVVQAQNYDYKIGDKEFTLTGSGSNDDDFDNVNFNIQGSLGFFLTESLEFVLRQDYGYADIPGGDDLWTASTRAGLDFVFDLDRLKPFVGANIGYVYGDEEIIEDQFIAGPEAGLKFFATPTAFIYGQMEWQFLFEDIDEAEDKFEDGRFVYGLGIGFKF